MSTPEPSKTVDVEPQDSTGEAQEDLRYKKYVHPTDKNLTLDAQVHIYDEIPDEAGIKLIAQVRQWMEESPSYLERKQVLEPVMTDLMIFRFCRARQFNLVKIQEMITNFWTWHRENLPITFAQVKEQCVTGKVSQRGFDKYGRPVLVLHNEFENSKDYPNMIKHMIYNLDRTVHYMNKANANDTVPGISRYVVILNMSNFSYSSQPPMSVAKAISNALGEAYCERLGSVFIFNAPWLFRAFYTTLTMILDSRTKSKIHFVKEDDYNDKLTFFLGDNWRSLTGLEQPQIDSKTAPGFKPDEWIAQCEQEDLERFGKDDLDDAIAAATDPDGLQSPSAVLVVPPTEEEMAEGQ